MKTITLCDYNPDWPNQFALIQADLETVLGSLTLRVDHIGSTSVPGMGAKDVIDVQVTVAEFADEIVDKLTATGYVLKPHLSDHIPPGEDPSPHLWEKRMCCERPGERAANIHVRKSGNLNQRYALLFKDYLRAHPNSAATIDHIKRELARYHPNDWDAYYDIKDPVYDIVWQAGKEWATFTQWVP